MPLVLGQRKHVWRLIEVSFHQRRHWGHSHDKIDQVPFSIFAYGKWSKTGGKAWKQGQGEGALVKSRG